MILREAQSLCLRFLAQPIIMARWHCAHHVNTHFVSEFLFVGCLFILSKSKRKPVLRDLTKKGMLRVLFNFSKAQDMI